MGIPDVRQVNANESALVAVLGSADVDHAGIDGVNGDCDVVIPLRELCAADDGIVRQCDVVRRNRRIALVALVRRSRDSDLGPVLTEVLGDEDPIQSAGGRGDDRIKPALVDGILGDIAGRIRNGQGDSSLGAVGRRAVDRVDVWRLPDRCRRRSAGLPMPPSIWCQTCPWFGLMKTPVPRIAAYTTWRLPCTRVPDVGLTIAPLPGARTTEVACPDSINCQVLPVS